MCEGLKFSELRALNVELLIAPFSRVALPVNSAR